MRSATNGSDVEQTEASAHRRCGSQCPPQVWLLLGFCLSGCLVTNSFNFGGSGQMQTRPYLNGVTASPLLEHVRVVDGSAPGKITFSVQVQAEDEGAPLQARLIADRHTSKPALLGEAVLEASTFDTPRVLSIDWYPTAPTSRGGPLEPGCHSVTLVVTHAFDGASLNPKDEQNDAALLVWWVLRADPADPAFLVSIPVAGAAAGCAPSLPAASNGSL